MPKGTSRTGSETGVAYIAVRWGVARLSDCRLLVSPSAPGNGPVRLLLSIAANAISGMHFCLGSTSDLLRLDLCWTLLQTPGTELSNFKHIHKENSQTLLVWPSSLHIPPGRALQAKGSLWLQLLVLAAPSARTLGCCATLSLADVPLR